MQVSMLQHFFQGFLSAFGLIDEPREHDGEYNIDRYWESTTSYIQNAYQRETAQKKQ